MLSNQEINKEFFGIKNTSDYSCFKDCYIKTCELTDGKCLLHGVSFRTPKLVIEMEMEENYDG